MVVFLIFFLIISGRFIYIQVTGEVNDVSLEAWAKEKRETSVVLPAERGKIYDRNGMTLAYNRPTYRIYAIVDPEYSKSQKEPLHVVDPEETAEKLAPLLGIDEKEILERLHEGIEEGKFQVEFGKEGKNLSQQVMEEINELQLPGINFMEDSIRYYPNGMFASHIIGFASPDEDTGIVSGVTGLEKEKNKLLSGTDGFIRYHRDKYNKKLLESNEVVQHPEDGHDIYLTIDQKIQTILEDVLSQVDEKYNPSRITAVVMHAKTGEILAMGSRPSFNPNNPEQVENWYNDVISIPVEPGSTAKIFTWAAAIEEGVYNGNELFQSGKYVVNEKIEPINDHNQGRGWGKISFDEGFRRSSNVAASKLVWEKLGTDTFLEYLQKFHLDEPTNIDLPNEVPGQILYNWPSEKLRTAFGQGSTMTPIQQIKGVSAIANEGKMLKPFVVKKVVDPNSGEVVSENSPEVVGEPISKETAQQMIELLDDVVTEKDGTGRKYQLDDYSVVGKTGTAQIPNPNGSGYLTGRENNIFSFLGMAPKEDPQIIMHVSVKQPSLSQTETGSDPVAFIFNHVMENALHYLNIEPDKEDEQEEIDVVEIPQITNKKVTTVQKDLEKLGFEVSVVGEGEQVAAANVEAGEKLLPRQRIILITDKPTIPNMTGWSLKDVSTLANLLNIEIEISGQGFVVDQSVESGTKIKDDLKVEVKLEGFDEESDNENDE